ncbi:MAG: 50S ribosomal protein L25 [Candidatus Margulisiibacteriota bacterium]
MELTKLAVKKRQRLGKNKVKSLKSEGLVPCIVYGKGEEPIPVSVELRSIEKIFRSSHGKNSLIELSIDDAGTQTVKTVISHEIDYDPIYDTVKHVDFMIIDENKKIKTTVKITFKGTAAGEKMGGVSSVNLHQLDIECKPSEIPDFIQIDISSLNVGQNVKVRDLKDVYPQLHFITPEEEPIIKVEIPKVQVEETVAAAPAADAAASAAAPTAEAGKAAPAAGKAAPTAGKAAPAKG